jgi:CHRD domain
MSSGLTKRSLEELQNRYLVPKPDTSHEHRDHRGTSGMQPSEKSNNGVTFPMRPQYSIGLTRKRGFSQACAMKPRIFIFVVFAVAALMLAGLAIADPHGRNFRAGLDGFHETPLSLSTNGTGSFRARLNHDGDQLTYELQYSGLEGGNVLFAHVHIGQMGTTGGVMFFLCGGGGQPACPNSPATVTGTVTAANVIGPAGQGVAPGEFEAAIDAMREGSAYANVHTTVYPSGEIRGQINEDRF